MPRVQMTRTTKFALFFLRVYLILMPATRNPDGTGGGAKFS